MEHAYPYRWSELAHTLVIQIFIHPNGLFECSNIVKCFVQLVFSRIAKLSG